MLITDIYVTFEDSKIPELLYKSKIDGIFFHFYDECTRTGKKDAWALKGEWGARKSPFILVTNKETPVKAFYSEADDNVINSLINWIENGSESN